MSAPLFPGGVAVAASFMVPLFLPAPAAPCAGGVALGGWLFSVQSLSPNFSRLNPASGLVQIFSGRALGELARAGRAQSSN